MVMMLICNGLNWTLTRLAPGQSSDLVHLIFDRSLISGLPIMNSFCWKTILLTTAIEIPAFDKSSSSECFEALSMRQ